MVDEKLWGNEVADAARFAEQAKRETNGEEMSRKAEHRISQVSANKVSDDTRKK